MDSNLDSKTNINLNSGLSFQSPIAQSLVFHLLLVGAVWWMTYKPHSLKRIPIVVYENPRAVDKVLNLEPPKTEKVKPAPPPPESKSVFGVSKKSITTETISETTAEVKLGNTVAKEQDDLKLTDKDAESLPIPADDYLVTSMPVLLSEVRISYPEEAKKAGIEGPVVMDLLIDEHGKVRQVSLIKGPGFGLNEAAITAINNFRFRPAQVQEKSVAVKIRYTYRFVLENR